MRIETIGLLGFGEAGQALASGWRQSQTANIAAYDVNNEVETKAIKLDVGFSNSPKYLTSSTNKIFSVVTADQAVFAAETISKTIRPGTYFFDCNSCAPNSKKHSAEAITSAGGYYFDVAIMAPVHPKLHRVPLLISGPKAPETATILKALDMDVTPVGLEVGHASAMKLTRSIMIKGMEALMAECFVTARKLGVEEFVIKSLENTNSMNDWRNQACYSLERMAVHGRRRAAEMEEARSMIEDLELPSDLTRGTIKWQSRIADLKISKKSSNSTEITAEIFRRLHNPEEH